MKRRKVAWGRTEITQMEGDYADDFEDYMRIKLRCHSERSKNVAIAEFLRSRRIFYTAGDPSTPFFLQASWAMRVGRTPLRMTS